MEIIIYEETGEGKETNEVGGENQQKVEEQTKILIAAQRLGQRQIPSQQAIYGENILSIIQEIDIVAATCDPDIRNPTSLRSRKQDVATQEHLWLAPHGLWRRLQKTEGWTLALTKIWALLVGMLTEAHRLN